MGVLRTVGLLTLLLLCACARTDLGAPCHVEDAQGAELAPQPGRQYLYLGSSECGSFSCLATSGSTTGYCSQACAGSGATCPAGLVCEQLTVNSAYLDVVKGRISAAQYQQMFGQLESSWYCVKPH